VGFEPGLGKVKDGFEGRPPLDNEAAHVDGVHGVVRRCASESETKREEERRNDALSWRSLRETGGRR
jgi:hypothetical protein